MHFDRVLHPGVPELSTGDALLHGVVGALRRDHAIMPLGVNQEKMRGLLEDLHIAISEART